MFGGQGSKINSLEIGNAGIIDRAGRAEKGKAQAKHEVLRNADRCTGRIKSVGDDNYS